MCGFVGFVDLKNDISSKKKYIIKYEFHFI